ncbi:MAG: chitobiase/beta-hexosaminidase C-terminal domain-containing protein [Actinobacteria bacterium]|nr:chitobiase/beta-hexosaminidase C-terminal domain-containing protein [Actinomycetota bacterium]
MKPLQEVPPAPGLPPAPLVNGLPPLPDVNEILNSLNEHTLVAPSNPVISNIGSSNTEDSAVILQSINNLSLSVSQQETISVTVSPDDAVLSALSSDTGIAGVSVSGSEITVNGVAPGTAIITVAAAKTGYAGATVIFTVTVCSRDKVENPIASPAAGTYNSARSVSLSASTEGSVIWYTTDGSDPRSSGTRQQYSTAIIVDESKTINAYAVKEGLTDSDVVPFTYVINAEAVITQSLRIDSVERVNLNGSGGQTSYGHSKEPSLSAGGRYVAFVSSASNLIQGDTNEADDIFVRDRQAGTTVRVNVTKEGQQSSSAISDEPCITPDGRFVAFRSGATNLVSADSNNEWDIFVHDRDVSNDGTFDEQEDVNTVRVSVDSQGTQADNYSCYPSISDDGRYVSFYSRASNLVAGDTNGKQDIFVHNRDVNNDGVFDQPGDIQTVRASVSGSGAQADQDCYFPRISGNGRYVAYSSGSTTLGSGITDFGVYIRDLTSGTTEWAGAPESMDPSISTDGRYIAFEAADLSNLVPGDSNSVYDIFVLDRDPDEDGNFGPGTFERVSISSGGEQPDSHCFGAAISPEGRFATFYSSADNLVPGDTNGVDDVFIHDRESNMTKCVSTTITGWQGNAGSFDLSPVIRDGNNAYVAYTSDADNIVAGDTNLETDIFMTKLEVDPAPDITPPSAPATFTVEMTGLDWAKLKWTPSADNIRVTRYEIYRGPSINGPFSKISTVDGADTSCWDLALATDTAYYYYAVALDEEGNVSPQSSNASCATIGLAGLTPAVVPVSGGYYHSLIRKGDGTVWAWGENRYGEVGDGTDSERLGPVQVKGAGGVGNLDNVAALDAGEWYSTALKNDGTVWAWGRNNYGQLGSGTTSSSFTPAQVRGPEGTGFLTRIKAVAAGYQHAAALRADGTVWTWGVNFYGELGDGTGDPRSTPVPVRGPDGIGFLTDVVAIAAGNEHTLALKSDGTVWAWGKNGLGELGIGAYDWNDHLLPVQVTGLGSITAIAADEHFSMALGSDGTAWTWGDNYYGGLGDGTGASYRPSPVQVVGENGSGYLAGVSAIAAGFEHTVALKPDGTVWVWGENMYGELGNGTKDYNVHQTPIRVPGLSGITGIYAGYEHTFAVDGAGAVWGWGANFSGQLGDGTKNPSEKTIPEQLHSLTGAANFAPVASNVQITGTAAAGQTLTGAYTYSDAEGDAEGESVFSWYADGAAIPGATSTTYLLAGQDAGKTIQFEVTPVAVSGTSPGTPASSAATQPVTEQLTVVMASVSATGSGADSYSCNPAISSDGRYVAFYSGATDLVAGDGNSTDDIFLRDLQEETTERISVSTVGTDSNSNSYLPAISADGRYVAFISAASNLVDGDTNGKWDVFVRDRQLGSTDRVSVPDLVYQETLGDEADNDSYASYFTMFCPSVSSDGRCVAFASQAGNLVPGDNNNTTDVFVHNRLNGQTVRASVYGSGTGANDWSMKPSISSDGRYVAFISNADNLVGGDTNGCPDVFVRDLLLGITVRVSVAGDGAQGNYFSGAIFYPGSHEGNVSISAGGRYVVFDSLAGNLAAGDTNGTTDIFVHDRDADEDGIFDEPGAVATEMASVSSDEVQADSSCEKPSISPNGRYVAFVSYATNLVGGVTTSAYRIYVRDMLLGTTGKASPYTGYSPCVADDGSVAFHSGSTNLLPEDTNVYEDVFVRIP